MLILTLLLIYIFSAGAVKEIQKDMKLSVLKFMIWFIFFPFIFLFVLGKWFIQKDPLDFDKVNF